MRWELADRFDPHGASIADRHYNRQKIGSPQFVPPGTCLVLTTPTALWVTSWPEFVQHAWPGAWMNTTFRNENRDDLSSELIREAVAATRWRWPDVPEAGMVTFIDPMKTRRKRDPGRCYRRAGFVPCGTTKSGLVALRLAPEVMPEPAEPIGAPGRLW